jgi:hypothetical protein
MLLAPVKMTGAKAYAKMLAVSHVQVPLVAAKGRARLSAAILGLAFRYSDLQNSGPADAVVLQGL